MLLPASSSLVHVPQQIAALEVLVGVDDGLELGGRHDAVVARPFQLRLVQVFEHAVSSVR